MGRVTGVEVVEGGTVGRGRGTRGGRAPAAAADDGPMRVTGSPNAPPSLVMSVGAGSPGVATLV